MRAQVFPPSSSSDGIPALPVECDVTPVQTTRRSVHKRTGARFRPFYNVIKGWVCNEREYVEPDVRGGGCHQRGVVRRNERADQRAATTAAGPKAARAEETAGAEETGRGAKAAAEAATRPAGAAAEAAATAPATAAGAAPEAAAAATAGAATE